MKQRCMLLLIVLLSGSAFAADRPNVLWISAEDISPHLGCFGDDQAITPYLDQLATEGVRYTRAFTTAGVCAPCRSGIITGMYQTTLGTQHMRCNAELPSHIKPFPTYLRDAGYYCTNNSKQDYQFRTPAGTWDRSSGKAHWRGRKDGQSFFAVFNFTGCHESGIASASKYASVTKNLKADQRQDPKQLKLPPYYPDTQIVREDWKRNYELITAMDAWAGNLIQQLKDDGLYEDTIIFFWSDHGVGLPRAKRWLYDSGTHIPLIVRIPAKYRVKGQGMPNAITDELVSSIDFGPTVLSVAGIDVPDHVQGRAFLGKGLSPERDYVYGARDRMDERYDIIRMVRDKRFKYIRNYEPLKTFYQYMNTPEKGATMGVLRTMHEAGKLPPAAEYLFSPTKPVEELYDCNADPYEINNLAADPKFADVLKQMRTAHMAWVKDTKDLGLIPEPIIAHREKTLKTRYNILRQADGDELMERVGTIAPLASEGSKALPALLDATNDADDAVRYWGAVGVGNIGMDAKATAKAAMKRLLTDPSVVVRTAAARALCRMAMPEQALPVLTQALKDGAQWERLHAAIVLDEIDDQARPVLDAMKAGIKPRKDLLYGGKYTVRVLNRAVNELMGTNNRVP